MPATLSLTADSMYVQLVICLLTTKQKTVFLYPIQLLSKSIYSYSTEIANKIKPILMF